MLLVEGILGNQGETNLTSRYLFRYKGMCLCISIREYVYVGVYMGKCRGKELEH